MRQCSTNNNTFNSIGSPTSKFDVVIEKLLAALFLFMPLALGARSAWTEQVVIALSAAIAICFSLKLVFNPAQRLIWTWGYVPIAIFLLLVTFQLIELPAGIINIISPETNALRTELLADVSTDAAEALQPAMPLSFYPNATKHDLRLLLALTSVFAVVLNTFQRPSQIRRLLKTIAIIGGGIAIFALVQDIFGNGNIYWLLSGTGKAYSGPFINHNHYGQFMNLSIGATIAYLCTRLHEGFIGREITLPVITEQLSWYSAKLMWFLIITMSIGIATVFISLTRGGMISMLSALAFTTFMLTRRKSLKGLGWIMVAAGFIAFAGIILISFDVIWDRLATLKTFDGYQWRWETLKDLAVCYKRFPLLGTGMGTHSVVYPMFQTINTTGLFTHAENEYAQVMEEVGMVGLITLIAFAAIVWTAYVRATGKNHVPICSTAYGLGFGLLAIMINSFSDYGQHIPANAFLSVTFCALLVGLNKCSNRRQRRPKSKPAHTRIVGLLVLVVICVISTYSFVSANNARIAESYWKKVLVIEKQLMEMDWLGTDAEYSEIIELASAASDRQRENIKYRYWLNVYRWYDINRQVDPDTGAIDDELMPTVHDIVDEFHKISTFCPTFGPTYTTLGQIERFAMKDESRGIENLRKGFRLAPSDPVTCLAAGYLDIEQNRIEDSFEKLSKAVLLNGRLFKNVAAIFINKVNRPELAVTIAAGDTGRLAYIAQTLKGIDEHKYLVEKIDAKIFAIYEEKCAFVSLANLYRKQHKNDLAIECYKNALKVNYGNLSLRLTLARLLAEEERIPEAMVQAKICLRIFPHYTPAIKLVKDLAIHPQILKQP